MGFFSSLWSGFKSFAKGVAKAAAVVVTAPIWAPVLVADKLGIIDLDGKKSERIADDVSRQQALNETSSVNQVNDIAKAVKEYYREYSGACKDAEKTCKDQVSGFFDNLIDELKKNEKLAESFGMEQLRRKKDRLCSDIDGALVNALTLKLSIDNYECRQILSMDAGYEKKRRMQDFANKTIRDAKEDLADKVSRTMKQVTDELSDFLQDHMDSQERAAERVKNKFEQWERDMNHQAFDRERAQLPALTKLYAVEQIEKIIAA